MKKLIINYSLREKRFALAEGDHVEKVVILQPHQESAVGNIYLGTVTKVLPGMNAVFIDLGEEKNGYLQREKSASFFLSKEAFPVKKNKPVSAFLFQGEKLFVQVEKDETGSKGPRLTGMIELHGQNLIYLPKGKNITVSKKMADETVRKAWEKLAASIKTEEEGFIFRTSSAGCTENEIITEIEKLRKQYSELKNKADQRNKPGLLLKRDLFFEEILQECRNLDSGEVLVDDLSLKQAIEKVVNMSVSVVLYQGKENIFAGYKIEHEIDHALHKKVELENGAYLVIDETEALTAIDVNTGKFSGRNDLAETVVKTNLAAAAEIAKQLRLRDIGGIVLIDFIDMKSEKDRKQVLKAIETNLSRDKKPFKILGFTPLGILELTRKKTKQAISEALMIDCPVCEGTGRVLSPETAAFRLERELWEYRYSDYEAVWVETTEEVCFIFSGEKDVHLKRLEEILGLTIFLTEVSHPKPFYHIRQFGKLEELAAKIKH